MKSWFTNDFLSNSGSKLLHYARNDESKVGNGILSKKTDSCKKDVNLLQKDVTSNWLGKFGKSSVGVVDGVVYQSDGFV